MDVVDVVNATGHNAFATQVSQAKIAQKWTVVLAHRQQ